MATGQRKTPEKDITMQAQTTRTLNGNLPKLVGGLIIASTLVAGAIGLSTTGVLDFPQSDSGATSIAAPVYDTYTGPKHGEGLPHSQESTSIDVGQITVSRQIDAPLGEGYPLSREIPAIVAEPAGSVIHNRQLVAPQGEGFPMADHSRFIEDNSFDYASTLVSRQQIQFQEDNVWSQQGHATPAGRASTVESTPDYRFLEENVWEQQNQKAPPADNGARDY